MKDKFLLIIVLFSFCACDQAFEKRLDNETVTLLSPANNLETTDSLQTFYWQDLEGATQYQLQVVSPRFDSIVKLISDTLIATNRFMIDLNRGQFQWKVKALNNSSKSQDSDAWNLKVQ